ncbi:MAG: radical SAM protein [Acidobacteria bacterium RIFCSPLOWO2_12_FULL_67_14b]|nr:MAG: radical SAM protein [Acidobacteria bacterium RIFCSPLOWO2_12_FULL_67_14b]
MRVVLVSTYDLGRQPFGLASPAAWLRQAGIETAAVDLSRDTLSPDTIGAAGLVAFYLPMHTATRLALPMIDRVRAINPSATICAYGLYAPLNDTLLREHGVSVVLGPEAEAELVSLARLRSPESTERATAGPAPLARLNFIQPDRSGLPPLDRYARLVMPDGSRKIVGATDATRGCKHRCRHCPIVPVYDGQFRVVPVAVVLADVRAQVGQGAGHVTFGDPDFFNGPTHASRILGALHEEFPSLTYDVTIKVEHLLAHRSLLPLLARTGCLFVTSAVESVDDAVLGHLEKGHTRADFIEAARLCREAGLTLSPTFVAFTPWTTVDGYADLLDVVEALDLVGHVAPVQWGIRLLVTWQSRLLELADIARLVGAFDRKTLTFPWRHPDPRVDDLQRQVMGLAGTGVGRSRHDTFAAVRALAQPASAPPFDPPLARTEVPYLDEPWYC